MVATFFQLSENAKRSPLYYGIKWMIILYKSSYLPQNTKKAAPVRNDLVIVDVWRRGWDSNPRGLAP